jgi:hypothetical protein
MPNTTSRGFLHPGKAAFKLPVEARALRSGRAFQSRSIQFFAGSLSRPKFSAKVGEEYQ